MNVIYVATISILSIILLDIAVKIGWRLKLKMKSKSKKQNNSNVNKIIIGIAIFAIFAFAAVAYQGHLETKERAYQNEPVGYTVTVLHTDYEMVCVDKSWWTGKCIEYDRQKYTYTTTETRVAPRYKVEGGLVDTFVRE